MSRGTVREALRELQAAGLVDADARGRLHVHTPDDREIAELFQVRGALEGLAARAITGNERRADIVAELRRHLPPASVVGDFSDHMNRDLAFHERMVRLSENSILLDAWSGLQDRMRIIFFARGGDRPSTIMTRDHHLPIVDAIASGDHRAAHDTLVAHMEQAARLWVDAPAR
ncbi:GntR family transcriptional regulator [Mobilicoccus caccae]|uniref:GntR family transcriptional regulator n=1 Tax=Mobilicoccus caccae TaxID=1859295 RepID=A0ABQ6IKV5_9MICO|nr:GntR family transcriptional regulator [Mobilicoccus caccae]